jgi:histidine triad (HIT) family protein
VDSNPEWPRDCPFCRIAHGLDEARIVWEGADALAFFPLHPATVGHTLIVPRVHVADLWAADDALAGQLVTLAVRLGQAISSVVEPAGMNLITSAGAAASQSVCHLHLHIVPRWPGDNIGEIWPPEDSKTSAQSEQAYGAIRDACRRASARP